MLKYVFENTYYVYERKKNARALRGGNSNSMQYCSRGSNDEMCAKSSCKSRCRITKKMCRDDRNYVIT